MGSAIAGWFAANRDVYFGNATAVRDYRVQLRGNRSVILFGVYLAILIGVALFVYSNSTQGSGTSIIDAQARLREFYQVTIGLLGLTVCVVAPALTATTIVMERQRQSIDLIFSAPVSPKYYLVGKMISSFRYTWMLLVLALPIAAASVILGGASWPEVLVAYLLLSLQGLIMTAVALLMSTIAPKPVSAIIWSYAIVIAYNFFAFAVGEAGSYSAMGRGVSGEAPFFVALSPWTITVAARTYTTILGHAVPNWVLMTAISLLVTRICLLGAGSLLSFTGGREIAGLRFFGLVYTLGCAAILGGYTWPEVAHLPASSFGRVDLSHSGFCGAMLAWATMPMMIFVPFLACYGFDRGKRLYPNGLFSVRAVLNGTPAGGLLYVWLMIACLFGGFALGGQITEGSLPGRDFLAYGLYVGAFWTFFWAIGRLVSSFSGVVKTARMSLFAAFVTIAVLPLPVLLATSGFDMDTTGFTLWELYIVFPLCGQRNFTMTSVYAITAVLAVLSLAIALMSEGRTQRKLAGMRNYDEQPFQAA